jgi:hypothetical protein
MQLNPSTVEQVTAATNFPLAIVSLAAMTSLYLRRHAHPFRAWLWIGMFGGLAIATGLGVFAHGLALDPADLEAIWRPINAALGFSVACFTAGAVLDRWGPCTARRALSGLLLVSTGFFGYATFVASSFLPFILYEGLAMLFCLAVYLTLWPQRLLAGAGWMVVGVGMTILAAVLQAMPAMAFRCGVTFDHNGVFHLVQLPGLLCLLTGVQIGLGHTLRKESNLAGMFLSSLKFP